MLETDWGGVPVTRGAFRKALTHLISLAEKVQSVKGIVPEEIEETPIEKDTKVLYSWNKCCQETAIRLVAFGERLPEIIGKIEILPDDIEYSITDGGIYRLSEEDTDKLSQAILQELGIKD